MSECACSHGQREEGVDQVYKRRFNSVIQWLEHEYPFSWPTDADDGYGIDDD